VAGRFVLGRSRVGWRAAELRPLTPRRGGEVMSWLSRLFDRPARATPGTENEGTSVYPEWRQLTGNLRLLHPLMLTKLQTAMCFIVLDEGQPHAATIVRVPSREFPHTIATTPMRLYVGLCRTQHADLFFFYPVVADARELWWAETWILPYDDELIGPAPDDPLAREARRRLELLLNQEYSLALIVDENNRLRCARRIPFTRTQRNQFPKLARLLKGYAGKRISLAQVGGAISEYLAAISKQQLQQQFELLLREE
jgi:hypothetical protein